MHDQRHTPAPHDATSDGSPAAHGTDDTACLGCGTCCRKGGPALHAKDLGLFRAGHLAPEHCLTLRAGELARALDGELRPLERELVKLRPRQISRQSARNGDWTCLFLNQSDNRCGVYAHRPAECRALLCRDTRAITALHGVDRVSRLDVLAAWAEGATARAGITPASGQADYASPTDGATPAGCADPGVPWGDILAAHEERCGYAVLASVGAALQRAAEHLRARNPGMAHPVPLPEDPDDTAAPDEVAHAVDAFLEAVRFDFAFRSIVRERAGAAMEELDFLLGRTVAATAAMYGVAVRMGADGPEVVVLPASGN